MIGPGVEKIAGKIEKAFLCQTNRTNQITENVKSSIEFSARYLPYVTFSLSLWSLTHLPLALAEDNFIKIN